LAASHKTFRDKYKGKGVVSQEGSVPYKFNFKRKGMHKKFTAKMIF